MYKRDSAEMNETMDSDGEDYCDYWSIMTSRQYHDDDEEEETDE